MERGGVAVEMDFELLKGKPSRIPCATSRCGRATRTHFQVPIFVNPANKHGVQAFPDMLKMIRQLGQHQRRRSLTPYNTGTRACVAPRAIRIRFHPRRCRHRQQGMRQPRVEVPPRQWHAANISGSGCTVLIHPSHGPNRRGMCDLRVVGSTTTSPMDLRRQLIRLAPNSGPVRVAHPPALTSS